MRGDQTWLDMHCVSPVENDLAVKQGTKKKCGEFGRNLFLNNCARLEIVDKTVTQAQKEWKKDEDITSSGNQLDSYRRKVRIEISADGGLPCDLLNFLFSDSVSVS